MYNCFSSLALETSLVFRKFKFGLRKAGLSLDFSGTKLSAVGRRRFRTVAGYFSPSLNLREERCGVWVNHELTVIFVFISRL